MFAIGEQKLGTARITMNIGRAIAVQSIRAVSGRIAAPSCDRLGTQSLPCCRHAYQGAYCDDRQTGCRHTAKQTNSRR